MKKTKFFARCHRSYQNLVEMCDKITEEYSDIKFSVVQCDTNFQSPIQIINLVKDISDFYNENWLGNADYLHVPDAKKVLENYLNYPIIMAYRYNEDGEIDILGVSTLKYYQNTATKVNPYYPIPNKRFFEITGILTKRDSNIKNIGKKIYEILIKALEEYQKILPEFDVIFVADCRNYMSLNGARGGAKYIREQYNDDAFGRIIGIYTVRNNGVLVEAPTFVAKFEFQRYALGPSVICEYKDCPDLFEEMLITIRKSLNGYDIAAGIKNMDDCGEVTYYEICNSCINLDDITILPNGTELGNDRIPHPRIRKRVRVRVNNE